MQRFVNEKNHDNKKTIRLMRPKNLLLGRSLVKKLSNLSSINEQKAYGMEVQLVIFSTINMQLKKMFHDISLLGGGVHGGGSSSENTFFINIDTLQRQVKNPLRIMKSKTTVGGQSSISSTIPPEGSKKMTFDKNNTYPNLSRAKPSASPAGASASDAIPAESKRPNSARPYLHSMMAKTMSMRHLMFGVERISQNTKHKVANFITEEVMKEELLKVHFHHVTESFTQEIPVFPRSALTVALFVVDAEDPWGRTGFQTLKFRDTEVEYAAVRPYKSILAVQSTENEMSEEDLFEFQRRARIERYQWAAQFNWHVSPESGNEFRELLGILYKDMTDMKPPSEYNLVHKLFPDHEKEVEVKKSVRCGSCCSRWWGNE